MFIGFVLFYLLILLTQTIRT